MRKLDHKIKIIYRQLKSKKKCHAALWVAKKALIFFYKKLLYIPAIFIALGFLIIRPLIKIKLVRLFSKRIGHYSANNEIIVCAYKKGLFGEGVKVLFYTYPGAICNQQLHLMWKRVIPIIPLPNLMRSIDGLLSLILMKSYRHEDLKEILVNYQTQDVFHLLDLSKTPHIYFTEQEKAQGQRLLVQLGVPMNSKFICLMARDAAYLNKQYPDSDWGYHNYRDVDVEQYRKTALFFAEQGYYVLRMGKFVEKKFSLNNSRVIDYANHPLRCDFLDIYLSAHCLLMISTATGLDGVPQTFRRPILWTNVIFPEIYAHGYSDLFIFKKFISCDTGKVLSVQEMLRIFLDSSDLLTHEIFRKHRIRLVDNGEDELLSAAQEMLARVNGDWQQTEADALLQKSFWEKLSIQRTCLDKNIVGTDFLKAYTAQTNEGVVECQ